MAAEPFAAIFSNELREIAIRRGIKPQATGQEVSNDLLGLCLSGGGIRSATFCFGVGAKELGESLRLVVHASTELLRELRTQKHAWLRE